ncbi:galactitol-1-phosphate 5-dehydrogenase [Virgibacillus halophilus]|uniref:galactitol-1-phosphate 5-dehydrogenase n=1 Tax=Tigheibacillus halophilus TaxID=361280 RepID=UPI00363E8F08
MRALKLYGKQDIRFEDAEKPVIKNKNDVIVQVKAVGICGSDISRFNKLGPYAEGTIFGHEFAGVVTEIGQEVEKISIGDRVAGCPAFNCGKCDSCRQGEPARCEKLHVMGAYQPGAYAEYACLPAENIVSIPDHVDFDTAAMIEPSSVVVHGFYRTKLQPGSTVAIIGCGNIGLLAVQWAKIFGAKTVYAIDIDDEKLAIAKEVGADVVINSRKKAAHEQLHALNEGQGVDVAFESAGSPITSAQVFALPKKGGQVVFLGIPYADIHIDRFYFEKIVRNELTVSGSWNAISAPFPGKEWSTSLHYMGTGQVNVKPIISHRLQLRQGPETFERIINRKETFGKVLFYPELG